MEKDFVPYAEALELKELGFDEPCFGLFTRDNTLLEKVTWMPNQTECETYFGGILAPLYQQAFRWFREKYNINTMVYSNASGYLFQWQDAVGGTHRGWSEYEGPNDSGVWDIYEETELACLRKLIQIVKQK